MLVDVLARPDGLVAKPMIWPNFRTGAPLAIGAGRHLVAALGARDRGHAVGNGAGQDRIDRDDDVVAALRRSTRGAFFSGLSCMGVSCWLGCQTLRV